MKSVILATLVVYFMVGCASIENDIDHRIKIKKKFEVISLSEKNFSRKVKECVGDNFNESFSDLNRNNDIFSNKHVNAIGNMKERNLFVNKNKLGYCLERNSKGYPILASEAFYSTVNPKGVPRSSLDKLYSQVAQRIEKKGRAKVWYIFDNGNAFEATYSVDLGIPHVLEYSAVFKKAGKWKKQESDLQFSSSSMTSVSTVKYSGFMRKAFLLSHRTFP